MKHCLMLLGAVLAFAAGCDNHFHTLWHGEKLASGSTINVTSFNLVWASNTMIAMSARTASQSNM